MKSTCIKSESEKIFIPKSTIKLTSKEFADISAPTDKDIEASTNVVAK